MPHWGELTPELSGLDFSSALVAAELGPQLPLIQVFTPKRGKTQTWSTIHTATMPIGMRNSMVRLMVKPYLYFIILAQCSVVSLLA